MKKLIVVGAALAAMVMATVVSTGGAGLATSGESAGAFPGRNGKIAFEAGPTYPPGLGDVEIFSINPDGSDRRNLSNHPLDDAAPEWSPDGRRIVFMRRDPSGFNFEIVVMNGDGSGQTQLTTDPGLDMYPTWSPDGTKIAYTSTRSDPDPTSPNARQQIWVMNSDGGNPTQLTFDERSSALPAWSSKGQIAFARGGEKSALIGVMNANGGNQRLLTIGTFPDWSPDGEKIVFVRNAEARSSIWVMKQTGAGLHQVTSARTPLFPAWSPDGTKITFTSYAPSGPQDIWVMNPDGSDQKDITNTANRAEDLSDWQPVP